MWRSIFVVRVAEVSFDRGRVGQDFSGSLVHFDAAPEKKRGLSYEGMARTVFLQRFGEGPNHVFQRSDAFDDFRGGGLSKFVRLFVDDLFDSGFLGASARWNDLRKW